MPDKDEYNVTKQQIMADIDVSMGGKVAEEIIFGPDQVNPLHPIARWSRCTPGLRTGDV